MIILITFIEAIALMIALTTTSAFLITLPETMFPAFVFYTFATLLLLGIGGIFVIPILALVIGFVRWKFKGLNLSTWGIKEKYFFLFLILLYICVLVLMRIYDHPLQYIPAGI